MATQNNADTIDYDNTTSGLTATDVQAAIDESLTQPKLLPANNLSDIVSAATAFTNIKQVATTEVTGVVELGTQAEVDAGTAGKVVTADTLASRLSSFISSTASAAESGYWKDNSSGIIVQWGITNTINNDTNSWVNSPSGFSLVFPTNCFVVVGCIHSTNGTGAPATDPYLGIRKSTTSTFQYRTNALSGTNQISWIAVGN